MEDQSASAFIAQLVDEGVGDIAFAKSTFDNDFVLLAEFCEMEGPKPIFTIPSVFNSTFNLNTFAVRIMSVDCVSVLQTTDFSNFNVAGDIQVVLTELSEGAVAYVHHFVLYDICARGFVRPFCLAYVMKNHADLLSIHEKLSVMYSLVSELFHFGNALSFICDLILRLDHLSHLKKVLGEKYCDIFVDDKMLTESQKKGITQQALGDAILQLHGLVSKFKAYVESNAFKDYRALFEQRYKETMEKLDRSGLLRRDYSHNEQQVETANEATEEGLSFTARPSHQVPADVVSSILGKKYDKRLRNLTELCDTTNSVALDVLRYSLHVFTSKDVSLFNPFIVEASKAEQATKFTIGTNELPVLACIPNQLECCVTSSPSQITSVKVFLRHFIDLHIQAMATMGERADEQDEVGVDSGYHLVDDLSASFLSLLKFTSISLPAISATSQNSMHSKVGSFENIYAPVPATASKVTNTSPPVTAVTVQQQSGHSNMCSEDSSDSYKDALCYPESVGSASNQSSIDSTKTSHPGGGEVHSTTLSVLSHESRASADLVKEMLKSTKVSLIKLRDRYSFLPHIVYSFFIGRPVVVVGKESSMKSVSSLVYGLANMLPNSPVNPKRIRPWVTTKLTLRDLSEYGIIGLMKKREKNPVPMSLKMYVSVLDYEKSTLEAPPYRGDRLAKIFDATLHLSEKAFRRYLLQSWCELISEAYIRFTNLYTHDLNQYPPPLREGGGGEKAPIGVSCDQEILNYFVDTLRVQLLHAFLDDESLVGVTNDTIQLNTKKCDVIQNTHRKKKAR